MLRVKSGGIAVAGLGVAAILTVGAHAYSTSGGPWASSPVPFYVNSANADVSEEAAITALQAAMHVWNTQAGTPFRFSYAGRVTDTSTAVDGRNVIIFRSDANGSTVASTYSWTSGGKRVDSDIIFWDGGWTFFTGTYGCDSGAYIEDVAAHELGHSLGLGHSSVGGATMYPSYSRCSQDLRTLESDDIAGAQALYGSSGDTAKTNTAPSVSIANPPNNALIPEGTSVTLGGSARDAEEGDLSSRLNWVSSRDGQLGTGSSFSRVLSTGTHTITASVRDSGGLSGAASVALTVTVTSPTAAPAPAPSSPTLTATSYKVKGGQYVDLRWSGITASSVGILRDGNQVTLAPNGGSFTDALNLKGRGAYRYKVCAAGTTTCTNEVTVSF